jgi:hypothetical protein
MRTPAATLDTTADRAPEASPAAMPAEACPTGTGTA